MNFSAKFIDNESSVKFIGNVELLLVNANFCE